MRGRAVKRRAVRAIASLALVGFTAPPSCSLVPSELNLFPVYRHRLDRDRSLLELDVLWPVVHYEKTPTGGSDFRIRPFYRRIGEEETTEHQFLWPLGRVLHEPEHTRSRLLPFWWYVDRENEEGQRETDWTVLLLIWGGSKNGETTHFAFLPFYADIPEFLGYDRFTAHLFPLHVGLERGEQKSDILLWPLIGWGGDGDKVRWHRFLPFYTVSIDEERYERYSALWPFVHWGVESLDTGDPIHRMFLFPLFGRQVSDKVDAWTVLWPFFQKMEIEDKLFKLDAPWPIYRRHVVDSAAQKLDQWWLLPFVSHTETDRLHSWMFLYPLIWSREFEDPLGLQRQLWVLPFYWSLNKRRPDGTEDDFVQVWPFVHRDERHDGTGDWSALSPWPWRATNAYGVDEAYGWLWTLAKSRWRPGDRSLDVGGHLFTTRERDGRRQTSVPFLFSYEEDGDDATFRLFQFIPIPF